MVIGSRGMGALGPGVSTTGSGAGRRFRWRRRRWDVLRAGLRRWDRADASRRARSNNCRAATGTVAVAPATADYVVTALNEPPATAAASAGFTVTDTTQNAGTGGGAGVDRRATTCRATRCGTRGRAADRRSCGTGAGCWARRRQWQRDRDDSRRATAVGAVLPAGVCATTRARFRRRTRSNNCRASAGTSAGDAGERGPGREPSVEDPSANTLSGGSFRVTDITRNVGAANAGASTTRASTCRSTRYATPATSC